MKIVITSLPALGHFHPLVPLATQLRLAGHDVVVATSASFVPWVEAAGLPAVSAGLDWLESSPQAAFPELFARCRQPLELHGALLKVFEEAGYSFFADLMRLLDESPPDLVLHSSTEFVGPLAAEVLGLPSACVGMMHRRPSQPFWPSDGAPWHQARALLGLPEDTGFTRLWPNLYLDTYVPSFHPVPLSDFLPTARSMRPEPYTGPEDDAPAWLDALADRPTVYVTMGSVYSTFLRPFRTILDAVRGRDVDVIVTVGPHGDPTALGEQPPNVHVERYLSQAVINRVADVVVTHCGCNTMTSTLASGIPILAMPMASDQPYNAFRVASSGAGLRLDPATATPSQVAEALDQLLDVPVYRRNAERVRDEIARMAPVADAVPVLELVAAKGAPLTASEARAIA